MILPESKNDVQVSGHIIRSTQITLSTDSKDCRLLIKMLRDGFYKDPLMAMTREILSNARDAHREAGRPKLPIRVGAPALIFPVLEIQDYGVGMSPDRIWSVYSSMGSSTKRTGNSQTGGFGIGSKTPFAYGQSFTIDTVYNGTRYIYAVHVNEEDDSVIDFISETETDKVNGTTIKIPIRQEDIRRSRKCIQAICFAWDVKPTGYESNDSTKFLMSSADVDVYELEPDTMPGTSHRLKVSLDGLIYELGSMNELIEEFADGDERNFYQLLRPHQYGTKHSLILVKFDCGEMTVTAPREALRESKETARLIYDKLTKFYDETKSKLVEEATASPKKAMFLSREDVAEKISALQLVDNTQMDVLPLSFCTIKGKKRIVGHHENRLLRVKFSTSGTMTLTSDHHTNSQAEEIFTTAKSKDEISKGSVRKSLKAFLKPRDSYSSLYVVCNTPSDARLFPGEDSSDSTTWKEAGYQSIDDELTAVKNTPKKNPKKTTKTWRVEGLRADQGRNWNRRVEILEYCDEKSVKIDEGVHYFYDRFSVMDGDVAPYSRVEVLLEMLREKEEQGHSVIFLNKEQSDRAREKANCHPLKELFKADKKELEKALTKTGLYENSKNFKEQYRPISYPGQAPTFCDAFGDLREADLTFLLELLPAKEKKKLANLMAAYVESFRLSNRLSVIYLFETDENSWFGRDRDSSTKNYAENIEKSFAELYAKARERHKHLPVESRQMSKFRTNCYSIYTITDTLSPTEIAKRIIHG